MSLYKSLVFPLLKKVDPEKVHYLVTDLLKFAHKIPFVPSIVRSIYTFEDASLEREVFGLKFKNPVGLAAGFDKNALWVDELANLGFGFIEIGTVTPKAQPGNDKPRLFRLIKDEAIINRMGFNNEGSVKAAELLKLRKSKVILGGNIGKNKVTPNENALDDYQLAFNDLYPYVDYFVVNVSSPNTPGLRELQDKEPLSRILNALKKLNAGKSAEKPILLKIAPDLTDSQLDDIIEIVNETKIDGLIATNTTIERSPLSSSLEEIETIGAGGLSGKPLTKRSTEVIRYLHSKSGGAFPIIGVGGIYTADDAREKLEAGASLVQVYSGFIYEGPAIVKNICKGLSKRA
ncbi:quinone-dependent dihydroorotate dehydrogenase [Jiulongibacter sediminis]|uniref:Dihydroorotate dehydrogenase (quinone) n=1 Tax=Jiulongibacter sediminis TaxID=1605367 RepID=A0A0P7C5Y2_9BACT|nr:quinone-dependent dihydroorotate dehydrogenase [Jiulongibacter sediminis]KPM48747.1 dihydroorotate dehydrogenase [Jiulongibacter sediminis]TBX25281.1 dihydroorotate dehydrogenase [Jiulongibacter sediminis]